MTEKIFQSDPTATNMSIPTLAWHGDENQLTTDLVGIRKSIMAFEKPLFAVKTPGGLEFTNSGELASPNGKPSNLAGWLPPMPALALGDPMFCSTYKLKAAYYAGGMANAIASEAMVIALAKEGLLGSFGSGGLSPDRLAKAVDTIQAAVPDGPYMFNLLHNPFEPEMEQRTVEIYLEKGVRVVEAAAYLRLTHALVQYRVSGLSRERSGEILISNRVIAKISRREIALHFLNPAPEKILSELVSAGKISQEQAEIAAHVPMADDITVEADSGGHTDNQPLVSLLPSIIALRDRTQAENRFETKVRIGAGGGISTPESTLGAFMMGAAYVVTGSVNQACVESGASEHTRKILADADMADVSMAPSADMFEQGSRVQVLKKGTLFPMRAQKLYDVYMAYGSIEEIPPAVKNELESRVFMRSMEQIWQDTCDFFAQRNPEMIVKAEGNPKKKMALVFRWYLGLASRWSRDGAEDRRMDYQIWCGPSMGAFNEWARGTYLEDYRNRHVADVAWQLLRGCAYAYRVAALRLQGIHIPTTIESYRPE
ncbi:MAG: PfaD family polyunsaturated fatty acid/polyketide biosynthesis protein [Chloroflexi bacterium]|nr:PfaD family polyunsaturated fatty acid/polyketide biosynthesis protein [Chloroflexota bacterium]